jgi:hypothetical protein
MWNVSDKRPNQIPVDKPHIGTNPFRDQLQIEFGGLRPSLFFSTGGRCESPLLSLRAVIHEYVYFFNLEPEISYRLSILVVKPLCAAPSERVEETGRLGGRQNQILGIGSGTGRFLWRALCSHFRI